MLVNLIKIQNCLLIIRFMITVLLLGKNVLECLQSRCMCITCVALTLSVDGDCITQACVDGRQRIEF